MINKERMNEPNVRIPDLIERLGKGGSKPINQPEKAPENMQTDLLITSVNIRPNPFFTSITLEIKSRQNKQVIVRMSNEDGQIVKLFGWYLLKGTNVTTITELSTLNIGEYTLDIMGNEGIVLINVQLKKA